jgi:hypothetical protein
MIKYFCDGCGKEISGGGERVIKELTLSPSSTIENQIRIEVLVAINRTWNAGNICEDCVIKVVTEGKIPLPVRM